MVSIYFMQCTCRNTPGFLWHSLYPIFLIYWSQKNHYFPFPFYYSKQQDHSQVITICIIHFLAILQKQNNVTLKNSNQTSSCISCPYHFGFDNTLIVCKLLLLVSYNNTVCIIYHLYVYVYIINNVEKKKNQDQFTEENYKFKSLSKSDLLKCENVSLNN